MQNGSQVPAYARPRQCVPRAELLEDRRFCSGFHADALFIIPHGPPTPLRTGGAAFLASRGVLVIVGDRPGVNNVTVIDDGDGDVVAGWNGHTPVFHGINTIIVDARGRTNFVTYVLTGNLTGPRTLDVQLDGSHSFFTEAAAGSETHGNLTVNVQTAPPPKNLAIGP